MKAFQKYVLPGLVTVGFSLLSSFLWFEWRSELRERMSYQTLNRTMTWHLEHRPLVIKPDPGYKRCP